MDESRRSIVGSLGFAVIRAALAQASQASLSRLTIVPKPRGKGVGVLFPNLLTFKGSIHVIDVKGKNPSAPDRQAEGSSHD